MNPFEFVKSINTKSRVSDVELFEYTAFIINRVFSNTRDTVLYANEMNRYWELDSDMQYDFYFGAIPKNPRRYGAWTKADEKDTNLALVMEYFGYSRAKALQVIDIIETGGFIDQIKKALDRGGIRK